MENKGEALLSNFLILLIFLGATFGSGILAGVIYYDIEVLDKTLKTVNFDIPIQNNITEHGEYANISDFQDILEIVVYPVLDQRKALPYLTYFMIFGFIIALSTTAYVSSKNPVFFVLHLLFLLTITYFCNILSNVYIELLSDDFINQMMLNFQIYNKLMIYLPQIIFFAGLLFGLIAFINVIKPQSNFSANQSSLNYGGDY